MAKSSSVSRRRVVAGLALAAVSVGGAYVSAPYLRSLVAGYNADADQGWKQLDLVSGTTFAFDTLVSLSLYGSQNTIDEMLTSCTTYEQMFSSQLEGSEIYRLNHAQGASCEVSPQTYNLIERALEFSQASNGAFDLTVGSVSLLWDFENAVKPSDEAIQEGLTHVGYDRVILEGNNRVRLADPGTMIDLGAIAKGWIADDFARRLRDLNTPGAIINLGGNVYVLGHKIVDGQPQPWHIAIQDPNIARSATPGQDSYVADLYAADKSVVTSGISERHFVQDGVDYWHIIDPTTGYPKVTDLVSTTVVSDESTVGDALSTTLFLQGLDQGIQTLKRYSDVDAFFTTRDGREEITPGMNRYNFSRVTPSSNAQAKE